MKLTLSMFKTLLVTILISIHIAMDTKTSDYVVTSGYKSNIPHFTKYLPSRKTHLILAAPLKPLLVWRLLLIKFRKLYSKVFIVTKNITNVVYLSYLSWKASSQTITALLPKLLLTKQSKNVRYHFLFRIKQLCWVTPMVLARRFTLIRDWTSNSSTIRS